MYARLLHCNLAYELESVRARELVHAFRHVQCVVEKFSSEQEPRQHLPGRAKAEFKMTQCARLVRVWVFKMTQCASVMRQRTTVLCRSEAEDYSQSLK